MCVCQSVSSSVCYMLSFMLEGEPHLKVVDEKRDSSKTKKFQVCSVSVCVCVRACVSVCACVYQSSCMLLHVCV